MLWIASALAEAAKLNLIHRRLGLPQDLPKQLNEVALCLATQRGHASEANLGYLAAHFRKFGDHGRREHTLPLVELLETELLQRTIVSDKVKQETAGLHRAIELANLNAFHCFIKQHLFDQGPHIVTRKRHRHHPIKDGLVVDVHVALDAPAALNFIECYGFEWRN